MHMYTQARTHMQVKGHPSGRKKTISDGNMKLYQGSATFEAFYMFLQVKFYWKAVTTICLPLCLFLLYNGRVE